MIFWISFRFPYQVHKIRQMSKLQTIYVPFKLIVKQIKWNKNILDIIKINVSSDILIFNTFFTFILIALSIADFYVIAFLQLNEAARTRWRNSQQRAKAVMIRHLDNWHYSATGKGSRVARSVNSIRRDNESDHCASTEPRSLSIDNSHSDAVASRCNFFVPCACRADDAFQGFPICASSLVDYVERT